jgi:hypothetical protein
MRYLVAVLGSVFIFVCVWFLFGLMLAWILPPAWASAEITLGFFGGSLAGVIATLPAGLAAAHSFRASTRVKTRRSNKKSED